MLRPHSSCRTLGSCDFIRVPSPAARTITAAGRLTLTPLRLFGYGADTARLPALVSTIKLRRAGFTDCLDTEEMFRKWFAHFHDCGLLPRPRKFV